MKTLIPAHRVLITRKLKGLEDAVTFTSVHWHMDEAGSFLEPRTPYSSNKTMFLHI